MTPHQKQLESYQAANRETAQIVLADVPRFGGRGIADGPLGQDGPESRAHQIGDRAAGMSPEVQTLLEQLREKSRADIQRTPSPDCSACQARRLHRPEEWQQRHPKAGTGFYCAPGKPTAEGA